MANSSVESTFKGEIAFIGLGQMGQPMVRSLLRAGYAVHGFDLNLQAMTLMASEMGFIACATPQEAVRLAQTVVLMLPDSRIVDALLWHSDQGQNLAQSLRPGQILCDMGSSDPMHSRENFSKLAALGVAFIDAPVSGGVKRANDATLSIMVGGDKQAVDQTLPVLQAMGKNLVHVGQAGAGHAVKALNNYVSASGLLAVCEALVAAEKFGIDPHLVNQVFNTSTGKNNTTDVKVENFMLSEKFNSGFALALMRKDLQTAFGFIDQMGTPAEFSKLCLSTWAQAETRLEKGADHTALFKYLREL